MLYDTRYKWNTIGYALGLTRVNKLKGSYDKKLSAVVDKWPKQPQLSPMWEILVVALRDKTVDEVDIADIIEAKYLIMRGDGVDTASCGYNKRHNGKMTE